MNKAKEKLNVTRSRLLTEVNRELNIKRKNVNETMINSKTLNNFEKEHEVLIVSLKQQLFMQSPGVLVGGLNINFEDKNKNEFVMSPDKSKDQMTNHIHIPVTSPEKVDQIKETIQRRVKLSAKKLKNDSLIDTENKSRLIDKIHQVKNKKVFDQAEKGYSFLSHLVKNLKVNKSFLDTPRSSDYSKTEISKSDNSRIKEISKFAKNFSDKNEDYLSGLTVSSMDCMTPFIIDEIVENEVEVEDSSVTKDEFEVSHDYSINKNNKRNLLFKEINFSNYINEFNNQNKNRKESCFTFHPREEIFEILPAQSPCFGVKRYRRQSFTMN